MSVDVQKMFNVDLPAWIAKHSAEVAKIGVKARIHITGDGGGVWFIDASSSGPSAIKGRRGGANLGIKMSVEDLRNLMDNPEANTKRFFFANKIKVAGNRVLAFELSRVLIMGASQRA
jgi:hypothetical protein